MDGPLTVDIEVQRQCSDSNIIPNRVHITATDTMSASPSREKFSFISDVMESDSDDEIPKASQLSKELGNRSLIEYLELATVPAIIPKTPVKKSAISASEVTKLTTGQYPAVKSLLSDTLIQGAESGVTSTVFWEGLDAFGDLAREAAARIRLIPQNGSERDRISAAVEDVCRTLAPISLELELPWITELLSAYSDKIVKIVNEKTQ